MPHFQLTLPDGRAVHIRINHEALTISIAELLVYTFDLAGRLYGLFDHDVNVRRGLDGRMLARWRDANHQRARRWLDESETEAIMTRMRQDVTSVVGAFRMQGRDNRDNDDAKSMTLKIMQHALAFDYDTDVQRFRHIYRPISILPPDQYQALVLQATEGCSFNTCTFCALYRDRPFRIKTPEEFATHISEVISFFGPGISMRRSIFLADANALVIPQRRLLPFMEQISHVFHLVPAEAPPSMRYKWLRQNPLAKQGVFAFVDGLSAERKDIEAFQELRQFGLRRVYIGLESGHEPLLAWLQKPSTAADMVDAVQRMKRAGLNIGVIVLLGVGGRSFAEGHVRDTATALNAMPLDGGDIIYFSPFQPDPAAPYLRIAQQAGIELPSSAFMEQQRHQILSALTLPPPPNGPKRVPYNLADFVY